MADLPAEPRTEESALAWAQAHVPAPDQLRRHHHAGFDADEGSGGWAFTTPDRLVLVARRGSAGVWLIKPGDDPDAFVDEWLREERHRNRELIEDELGPCQRAALRLIDEDVLPLAVFERLAQELDDPDDAAAAAYLWVRMRRAQARGSDARRELAGSDELLEGRGVSPAVGVIACPVCGAPSATLERRYPRAVCDDCYERTTCVHGRPVAGHNTSLTGGFAAHHTDGLDPHECEETTRTGSCRIGDVTCRIGEAHFGGVIVEVDGLA